jgi:hypothetical protein
MGFNSGFKGLKKLGVNAVSFITSSRLLAHCMPVVVIDGRETLCGLDK